MGEKALGLTVIVVVLFLGNCALIAAWANGAQVDGYRMGFADAKANRAEKYLPSPQKCELK